MKRTPKGLQKQFSSKRSAKHASVMCVNSDEELLHCFDTFIDVRSFLIAWSRLNVFSISIATTYRVPMTILRLPTPALADETQRSLLVNILLSY